MIIIGLRLDSVGGFNLEGITLNRARWTIGEIRKLKLMVAGIRGIIIEGRTKLAIQYKIRALKLKKDRTYEKWTQEEIELLKAGRQVNGRQNRTVDRKRISLGLYKREPRLRWTEEIIKILKQAYLDGLSARQIYEKKLLPSKYTKNAIQKKMCRLGYARINKKYKKYKKFDSITKDIFKKFITENWMGKLPEELATMWNEKNINYPISNRRVVRYLTDLGLKVSCCEMGYIRRLKQYEQLQKMNLDKDNLVFVNERIRAKRVEMMARRFSDNKDIWTGLEAQVPLNMDDDD